jgi:hypothetical protein
MPWAGIEPHLQYPAARTHALDHADSVIGL